LASAFERTSGLMKRILLIGSSGQLGTALRAELADMEIAAPAHVAFDLVSDDPAALLDGTHYEVAINCAAFHNVDICEREPDKAFAANTLAVDGFARACAARDIAFMTISTDYVFDGFAQRAYTEADAPSPRTSYGVSKLGGELLTRRAGPKHYIVRTSGVFGTVGTSSKGYTLIDKVLGQAERGEPTRMVADMTFSPSYAPHVARAIHALIEAKAYGTHHVTNAGACSWFEFVQSAFAKAGFADAELEPVAYGSFGNPVQRPMYSPLANTTFAALGIAPLPAWEAALDEFLAARRARFQEAT
jgi:dTDP-4-dehydrorhamnose reductase